MPSSTMTVEALPGHFCLGNSCDKIRHFLWIFTTRSAFYSTGNIHTEWSHLKDGLFYIVWPQTSSKEQFSMISQTCGHLPVEGVSRSTILSGLGGIQQKQLLTVATNFLFCQIISHPKGSKPRGL